MRSGRTYRALVSIGLGDLPIQSIPKAYIPMYQRVGLHMNVTRELYCTLWVVIKCISLHLTLDSPLSDSS
jgi:hypothetical protein